MDVNSHTTTLRERTRLTSYADGDSGDQNQTQQNYIVIPGIGPVPRKNVLYGGGALALVVVLAMARGGGGYRFNFDRGL